MFTARENHDVYKLDRIWNDKMAANINVPNPLPKLHKYFTYISLFHIRFFKTLNAKIEKLTSTFY